jgi:ubiquinone/menaquinone biosynthesis C-methylase UbiE
MKSPSKQKREAFASKISDVLNKAALNLALAVGYRTGLLEVMDEISAPATVSRIAEKSGLNERYIREWLGVMVCGEVVELSNNNSGEDLFFLPPEHGDFITRRAGNENLGVYTQEVPLLTSCAFDSVIEKFSSGDGIGYQNYPKFQAFMSQLANAKHRQVLVKQFLPSVDGGRLVDRLRSGIRVCDLGCGEGIALMLMAESFPNSEFVGFDISSDVITKATDDATRLKLNNTYFQHLDAANLSTDNRFRESFDYVTAFDAIHDQSQPLAALKGVYSILKPGGLFSMIDIAASSRLSDNMSHSMSPFLYTVSLMHCMPVGLVNGGTGLGMMWGHQKAKEMLSEAGFEKIRILDIPGDPFNFHFSCRKPQN